jgi:cytochrome c oxidase subunit 2
MQSILAMSMVPEQASTFAPDVDNLYFYLWGTTIFFTVGIVVAILYFFVKYRRSRVTEIPQPIAGSHALETIWTVVPFLISLTMFGWAAKIYLDQYSIPKDALDIYVVGKQWMWKFQHPEGQREINELHVPLGKKVRLVMASEDVLHSFFVPAFRTKMDIVPGPNRYSTIWFQATKPGTYRIYCAEYCGTNHSGMIGWITVMNDQDYQAWLSGGAAEGSLAQRGQTLFGQLGCSTCHKSDGNGTCPKLEGVYGSDVQLTDGKKVAADDSYVRESILNPTAKVVAGYQPIMPTFQGIASEEQIQQLVAYVKSIGVAQAATSAVGGTATDARSSNAVANRPPIMMNAPPAVGNPSAGTALAPTPAHNNVTTGAGDTAKGKR